MLVAHSYFLRFDQKQLERARPYPPLATLQVASGLRQAGHEVSLFDAMLAGGVEEFDARLRETRPQLVLFYEDNYNFLSKMCLGKMRQAACEMIGSARRAGAQVIVAGSDASDAADAYLAAGAHVVVIGEGLATLRVLVDRLDSAPQVPITQLLDNLADVMADASSAAPRQTRRATALSLPPDPRDPALAAWDLIDMARYRAVWREAHGFFSLNMASSRGCPFRCAWCAKPIWGNRYLQRSADDVAAEMAYLKRSFEPDHIWFADDIFGFRCDWVSRFAAALKTMDGAVPFTIQTRADLVSNRMARALKEAGCTEVWIGAESGSQRVLDSMNKGTKVEEISAARARLSEQGVRVGYFIQLGYLGEQLDDILATRDLIECTRPDDIGVSVSYPLPGTLFYDLVKDQLQAKTRWQESNDLEMMFEGTYRSDFYRAIRDLLHDQVSIAKLNGEAGRARLSLQQRWDTLLSDERSYRSHPDEARAFDHDAVGNDG